MSYEPSHLKPNLIMGYTSRLHLMLDFDDITFARAKALTKIVQHKWPKVGDALISQSSPGSKEFKCTYYLKFLPHYAKTRPSYHIIFDNLIGYNTVMTITQTLADSKILERNYMRVRHFRGDLTLRITPTHLSTGLKPAPEVKAFIPNKYTQKHDGYISLYTQALGQAKALFDPSYHPNFV